MKKFLVGLLLCVICLSILGCGEKVDTSFATQNTSSSSILSYYLNCYEKEKFSFEMLDSTCNSDSKYTTIKNSYASINCQLFLIMPLVQSYINDDTIKFYNISNILSNVDLYTVEKINARKTYTGTFLGQSSPSYSASTLYDAFLQNYNEMVTMSMISNRSSAQAIDFEVKIETEHAYTVTVYVKYIYATGYFYYKIKSSSTIYTVFEAYLLDGGEMISRLSGVSGSINNVVDSYFISKNQFTFCANRTTSFNGIDDITELSKDTFAVYTAESVSSYSYDNGIIINEG